jgi:hypothetical protein
LETQFELSLYSVNWPASLGSTRIRISYHFWWSQSEVALYNQTNGLRVMTNRPVGPLGLYIHYASLFVGHSLTSSFERFRSAMSVFLSILYYLLLSIWFDSKFKWAIRIEMAFSVYCGRSYSSLDFILFLLYYFL